MKTRDPILTFLRAAAALIAFSVAGGSQDKDPGILFTEDFESGDMSRWDQVRGP